jgi:hypothetical protein
MTIQTSALPLQQRLVQTGFFKKKKETFKPNYWGGIEQFQVPCHLFNDNRLTLSPRAIKLLMVFYLKAKGRYKQLLRYSTPQRDQTISIVVSQKEISLKTGCSRNTISLATRNLVDGGWLEAPAQRRVRRGELGTNEYFLLDPKTGHRLESLPLRPYFTVPACIIRKHDMYWSLSRLSSSEAAFYITLLFRANQQRRNTFANDPILFRKMSDLTRGRGGSFSKAMESLQVKRLIMAVEEQISLCDPTTGDPPVAAADAVNDPANYYNLEGNRIVFNDGNSDALLAWVKETLPAGATMIEENNDEYKISCPFHNDPSPSLSFNPAKGCFHCFGCKAKGTIRELVARLKRITESDAIQQHARALGITPKFISDTDAEAIYTYTDKDGNLLYRKLRLPGKRFLQQRWTPEGWVYNTNGVKRTLYNLRDISFAAIVIITEGEKDADRVSKLELGNSRLIRVVATTSGGEGTWKDEFTDLLVGTHYKYPEVLQGGIIGSGGHVPQFVVVMPDSDAPGQRYANDITDSLERRKIPYCVVRFEDFKDVSDYLDSGHTAEDLARLIADEMAKTGHTDYAKAVVAPRPQPCADITL